MTPKTEQKVYVGIGMDFETGGLDCRECACTQIALQAVRFDTWQVFDHCQAYIAPYGKADAGLPRRKVLRTRHEQAKEAGVQSQGRSSLWQGSPGWVNIIKRYIG